MSPFYNKEMKQKWMLSMIHDLRGANGVGGKAFYVMDLQ